MHFINQILNEKSRPLTGRDNKRLSKTSQSDSQATAAWMGTREHAGESGVSIPGRGAVEHAKEWVDNGSRL